MKKSKVLSHEINSNFSSDFVYQKRDMSLSFKKIEDMARETDFNFLSGFVHEGNGMALSLKEISEDLNA